MPNQLLLGRLLKPDSYELTTETFRHFESWDEAWSFTQAKKDAGERGWRIQYSWGVGETIPEEKDYD